MEGGTYGHTDGQTEGRMSVIFSPCVLQDFGAAAQKTKSMKNNKNKNQPGGKFHLYDFFPVGESRLYWYPKESQKVLTISHLLYPKIENEAYWPETHILILTECILTFFEAH